MKLYPCGMNAEKLRNLKPPAPRMPESELLNKKSMINTMINTKSEYNKLCEQVNCDASTNTEHYKYLDISGSLFSLNENRVFNTWHNALFAQKDDNGNFSIVCDASLERPRKSASIMLFTIKSTTPSQKNLHNFIIFCLESMKKLGIEIIKFSCVENSFLYHLYMNTSLNAIPMLKQAKYIGFYTDDCILYDGSVHNKHMFELIIR